jgi:hypothetical protein
VAYGRKPADYDEDSFQGIHARFVLVILDEACGIPGSLWTAAETIATNDGCRVLAIGNPDTPLSQFKRACEPGSGWRVIHVDGLRSPNFTSEVVPEGLRELLLSPTWVEERRADWGEDSALFQSKVRGEFPAVPQGQVYRELGPHLQWYGELPRFSKVVGGLDFGGANDEAHMTAGVVAGLVASVGSTDEFSYGERIVVEEWSVYVGERGGYSRTEMSTLDGELLLVAASDGFETVHREVASGLEWRSERPRPDKIESVLVPAIVLWQQFGSPFEFVGGGEPLGGRETLVVAVEHPVTEPRERTELAFVADDPIVSRMRNYDFAADGSLILESEISAIAWAVLPAGTEFGTRP